MIWLTGHRNGEWFLIWQIFRIGTVCCRPMTHAQTWASYSALYRFGRLSLNVSKIKVMLFREVDDDLLSEGCMEMISSKSVRLSICVFCWITNLISLFLWTMPLLRLSDPRLNLYSVWRSRRASCTVRVQLCKLLVRPHLEYAVQVWAAASAKDLDKVEQL